MLMSLLFAGCGASGESNSSSAPSKYISANEFGDRWPLLVESGYVDCERGGCVVFRSGGETYAINGNAMSWKARRGYSDLEPIWKDDPKIPGVKVSIAPILDAGLRFCD